MLVIAATFTNYVFIIFSWIALAALTNCGYPKYGCVYAGSVNPTGYISYHPNSAIKISIMGSAGCGVCMYSGL
jgi:hypothetical protein